jgi:endonuclease/exonuclease/phosphatase family metal-dependent hydrolase
MRFALNRRVSRLRVVTYNIHGGLGTDGRLDLPRIADVIAAAEADIVALQEVDARRTRSGGVDQTRWLAERLGMHAHFGPTIERGDEAYGIATLTRLPIVESRQVCLPWRESNPRSEPRCALLTRLPWPVPGRSLDMVNTHLSVRFGERAGQVAALIDDLIDDDIDAPIIVAGDFNCTPWSRPYRALCGRLRCAASPRSWPAALPVVRLDHILFRGRLRVVHSGVVRATGRRTASDHAPVLAELEELASEVAA